jgi:hypothetical protein
MVELGMALARQHAQIVPIIDRTRTPGYTQPGFRHWVPRMCAKSGTVVAVSSPRSRATRSDRWHLVHVRYKLYPSGCTLPG